jgi:hypothetical protein
LAEVLKQPVHLFRGNADACIVDSEADEPVRLAPSFEHHRSSLGELARVREKIEQNLPQGIGSVVIRPRGVE